MCYDPWEHSVEKMGEDWLGHIKEAERGRNITTNEWKAQGFLSAIEEKYNDDFEFDQEELEAEVDRLWKLAATEPRWFHISEIAEEALKKRANQEPGGAIG